MEREDIIGGIKIALSKGQKLEDIMQSFYNSGYKKEDIEQAVNELFSETSQSIKLQLPQNSPQVKIQIPQPAQQKMISSTSAQVIQSFPQQKPIAQAPQTTQAQQTFQQTQQSQQTKKDTDSLPTLEEIQSRYKSFSPPPLTKQVVSSYKQKNKTDAVTIILIIALVLLLGILASVFIFRKQIVEFLNALL